MSCDLCIAHVVWTDVRTVTVAMSGGVDSSVALRILSEMVCEIPKDEVWC